jgi:hypothetical protein
MQQLAKKIGASQKKCAPTLPGQGRIDWTRIFVHAAPAGSQHIFAEQDRCDRTPSKPSRSATII